jgi:hypothetical protein
MERREFLQSLGTLVAGVAAALSLPAGSAEARVGRPASPGSVAGVRRRRRRRVVVVGMSMASLPASGCSVVARDGINYHYCGGVWYKPTYQGTEVVYVVDKVDPGTEAYSEDYLD